MRQFNFIARLRARSLTRTLSATTFCEECGGGSVCSPDCRREALHETHREALQRGGLLRW